LANITEGAKDKSVYSISKDREIVAYLVEDQGLAQYSIGGQIEQGRDKLGLESDWAIS
jgi:hypothetical protein